MQNFDFNLKNGKEKKKIKEGFTMEMTIKGMKNVVLLILIMINM